MYESLLNGVLHLFAILTAAGGGDPAAAARSVDGYLRRTLGIRRTEEYLALFTASHELYQGAAAGTFRANARKVADGLAARLSRREQHLVFLRLLELAHETETAGVQTAGLIEETAAAFALPEAARVDLEKFAHGPAPATAATADFSANFVLVSASPPARGRPRHLPAPAFHGEFVVLRVAEADLYLLAPLTANLTLDDNPIPAASSVIVDRGAVIRDQYGNAVSRREIEAFLNPPPPHPEVRFEAQAVEFRFPGSDTGLHGLDFAERSGRLIGIMGGSGAGKSTLLSILSGTLRPDSGRVLLNGRDLYAGARELEGLVGLVPQDDLLFEDLTVFQNLYFSARLSLAHLSDREIRERVAAMLAELNQAETAGLKAGSPTEKTISGGQRKRLNIALELIREPAVLFVDEPTSGLSSADSENVMNLLKEQTARGKLVFVVIHQPSSAIFKLFDSLWLLDYGGYPVFMGPPLEAVRHFREALSLAGAAETSCPECGAVNPEQLFQLMETRTLDESGRYTRERRFSPEHWHALFRRTARPATPASAPVALPVALHRPGRLAQTALFFRRLLLGRLANRQYLAVTLLEAPLLGLVTAAVARAAGVDGVYWFGENPNLVIYFFMSVICALFLGLSVSAEEIVRDRRILQRERFLHLSWSAYVNAKALYLALVLAVQMLLYTLVGVAMLALPDFTACFWFALFSVALCGGLFGLNLSAAFRAAVTVYILIPLVLIPQLLLGGVVIKFDRLMDGEKGTNHVPWIGELMASRWGGEALMVEQFRGNRYQKEFFAADRELSLCDHVLDDLVPEIRARLDFIRLATALPDKAAQDERSARLARAGIRRLETLSGRVSGFPDRIFTPAELAAAPREAIDTWLAGLQELFAARKTAAQRERRLITERLLATHGEAGLAELKRRHFNQKLADFVTNRDEYTGIRASGDRFVQVDDPIYQRPDSPWGRAVFLIGEKRLGDRLIGTCAFDLLVLWLMTGAFCLSLYARLPQRAMALVERRRD